MLVTSTQDDPATCTYSKTCYTTNTIPADPTTASTNDKTNIPPTLIEDQKDTPRLKQRTDPFCKCISKRLLSGKVPSHEVNTLTYIKGLIYKHVMDSNQRYLALVIPKSWHFTVLIEAHDKSGHQGISRTQHLFKCQYYWKGMNKDICKYINNCALCEREKARTQVYMLQMTDIPDRPSNKIAIDLVSDLNISASGIQHILTIIYHLTRWPEAFPIPDEKVDTIVNNYLSIYMYPHFKLSDNGTEFKNQLMNSVLQQLGIECIFSTQNHPHSNGKLEAFHKHLKPTIKTLLEKDLDNWDKYMNQVLASYCVTPHHATVETPFFLVYGRDPNLPLHQLVEPLQ